jgi:glycosyltransferase involved in cell wall biosynthesis
VVGENKMNHRLFNAWINSDLVKDDRCVLVFVGEYEGPYGNRLLAKIKELGLQDRVILTGWVSQEQYHNYLKVADIAVQLRTLSLGETSAAVLDCMNYGLPTVVNAHGPNAEIPDNAVWKLPEHFNDDQLSNAIITLWKDEKLRRQFAKQAQQRVHSEHNPIQCARQYYQAIENFYNRAQTDVHGLIKKIGLLETTADHVNAWVPLANDIARSIESPNSMKQIFIDVSVLRVYNDNTGIPRVVKSILKEWLTNPPKGYRVEPVYATYEHGYRYARQFTTEFLDIKQHILTDDPIEYRNGDIFFVPELSPFVVKHKDFLTTLRGHGLKVFFVVYDLLPVLMGQFFREEIIDLYTKWLDVALENHGAICISQSVAEDLKNWIANKQGMKKPYKVSWFHLGADLEASNPTLGMPENTHAFLQSLKKRPTFLMVGTIGPRKGYAHTLDAFEGLWKNGIEANLVIVGMKDVNMDSFFDKLCNHPKLNDSLFWLEGISDEYLEKIYAASSCLIVASEGEGFGLPIIEAAKHKLPVIARDIPVFREIAGKYAYYFSDSEPQAYAKAIQDWLRLHKTKKVPKSQNIAWLSWKQSAQQLWDAIIADPSPVDAISEKEAA